jgi:hypothetical protein
MADFPVDSGERGRQTRHHYELAHVALKQICFNDPAGFFQLMASPERNGFLEALWRQIRENCDHGGPAYFEVPRDLVIETFCLETFPMILVHMPPPRFVTESYFIGMVLNVPVEEMEVPREHYEVGYYTLERGEDVATGDHRTVFCAWQGETHFNYGDGPLPEPGAFVAAVRERLGREGN